MQWAAYAAILGLGIILGAIGTVGALLWDGTRQDQAAWSAVLAQHQP